MSGEGPVEPGRRDAPMLLRVNVIEARGLPAIYLNGSSDPYVRLQLGRRRPRATTVVKRSLSPVWDEEFGFLVGDVAEELVVSVLNEDRFFSTDFLGRVRVPLTAIMETEDLSLGTAWYQLQPRKGGKFRRKRRGEILLRIYLSVRATLCDDVYNAPPQLIDDITSSSQRSIETNDSSLSAAANSLDMSACGSMDRVPHSNGDRLTQKFMEQPALRSSGPPSCVSTEQSILLEPEDDDGDTASASSVVEVMSRYFRKSADAAHSVTSDPISAGQIRDAQMNSESRESGKNSMVPEGSFDELLKIMGSKDQVREMPGNLPGGVLVDQSYIIAPAELNSLLFSPNSDFLPAVAEVQGTSGFQIEPWKHEVGENYLKRTLTYTKAASKLVKSVKATEEQKFLKAATDSFAVLSTVSTPDVPCGACFKVEILYSIIPGPQLPSDEQTTQLTVSWRLNFVQSTMLKGMIENGTKQGLAEGYSQFSEILSHKVKVVELDDINSKDKILASLQTQKESNWKLVARFLGSFAFIFSLSSDHGVKAHGDGWLLTIALIEASGVVSAGTPGLPDPYVVFTCNGKKKTSSVKYQTSEPKWNEIFEFDAMDDPPARLDVVVYDSDGTLKETPIGQTEVNFVKNNLSDLGDMWLTLDGRFAQGHQPKVHLRVFLDNSRGTEVVLNYLEKMGKEVDALAFCSDKLSIPGLEARHGAKVLDPQGRLKFHFQTFVSFNDAHRIIMVIWKMRSSGEMSEKEEPELKGLPSEEGSLLANEDVKMSEVYSAVLSIDVNQRLDGDVLWRFIGAKSDGESRFDKNSSRYGGEATTTQKKYNLPNRDGWVIEEVMTLQGVLHEDYSSIQLKYHMTSTPLRPNTCSIKVLLGIAWLKGAKHQKKATKNVMANSTSRLREIFQEVEKEITSRKGAS
ncbi:hypothetical protein PR202_ga06820 [Eleusine coracana subsp. coracana]|uniref:C2 and GRAM domain-containing protein n=1 Tax=Eleusine coracana subsp. coracana TaxID=191504 RepID=A0AAV5BYB9_ELECO|nr:hypothetical protein PR202_ga06820 [Eleusine coracana subsp. coracana]